MASIRRLIEDGRPLVLPGVHDALGARIAAQSGFSAVSVGGAALAATQLGLPDLGLQSFGEYRDAVARIVGACDVPVVIDGENGFGDVKAVTRAVRSFEALGVAALAIEDLSFPPVIGRPPAVVPLAEIEAKLAAALAARTGRDMMLIGRTDAAYAASFDEAVLRAQRFAEVGADAVLVTGLRSLDEMKRLRDAVDVVLVAIVIEDGPWFAPTVDEAAQQGFAMVLHPAALMVASATAYRDSLAAIARGERRLPAGSAGYGFIADALGTADWAAIDSAA